MNNNYNIQTGYLFDTNGKKFDISVILNFPTDESYESEDFPETHLIDFYFGTPNDSDTLYYVTEFIKKQYKLQSLLNKLYDLKSKLSDDPEIDEQIEFVKSLIIKLH